MSNKKEVVKEEKRSFEKEIEGQRENLFKHYKRTKRTGDILTFVVLIFACAGLFLVMQKGILQILGWVSLLGGMVVLIVFNLTSKGKFNNHSKEYLAFVSKKLNEGTFDKDFKNISYSENKLEVTDIEANKAYVDVYKVASRQLVTGEYDSLRFTFVEAALFQKGEQIKKKKTGPDKTLFVGKVFDILNTLDLKEDLLIEVSGKEMIDEPNGMKDRTKLLVEDNFSVFGKKGTKYKTIIGEECLNALRKIKIGEHLLNLCISLTNGHTYVFMSYDDAVISIPFDKPFDYAAYKLYKKQVKEVLSAISLLGK